MRARELLGGDPAHGATLAKRRYDFRLMLEIATPHGPANVHLHPAERQRAALVLGHGAGGGIGAGDLVAAKDEALSAGLTVGLVEQPYRVAGRRSSAPAKQLEAAWTSVVEHLRANELAGLPLVLGGRSSAHASPVAPRPSSGRSPSSASPSRSGRRGASPASPRRADSRSWTPSS